MSSFSPLLAGSGTTEGIVAVQQADEGQMRLYLRTPEGTTARAVPFFPFFHVSDRRLLEGFPRKHWIKELDGDAPLRYLCAFESWPSMWQALRHLLTVYGKSTGSRTDHYIDVGALHLQPDPLAQFLLQSGETLFKGLHPADLRQLHLAAAFVREKSGRTPAGALRAIALADPSGWQTLLTSGRGGERELLKKFATLVRERDPDVIAAHGLTRQLLPRVMARCEGAEESLPIGRDQSSPRFAERHASEGPFAQPFWEIAGRHLIDTERVEDILPPDLFAIVPSDDLNVRRTDTTVEPDANMDDESLIEAAATSCTQWQEPSSLLFYACQIIPLDYGTLARSSPTQRIEGILLREYVRRKLALPVRPSGVAFASTHVERFATGLFGPVLHVRFPQMLPHILLRENFVPQNDSAGAFRDALTELNGGSPQAPAEKRDTALAAAHDWITRGFVDYLVSGSGMFSKPAMREDYVKALQLFLLNATLDTRQRGGKLLAFCENELIVAPPVDSFFDTSRLPLQTLVSGLSAEVVVLRTFKKALCFKTKTFAFLDQASRMWWSGHPLVPRNAEGFGKRFVRECSELLLAGDLAGVHAVYVNFHQAITQRHLEVGDFLRMEVLRETFEKYREDVDAGRRKASPAYELARLARKGDRPPVPVAYYITSTDSSLPLLDRYKLAESWDRHFRDEDPSYYLQRLDDFAAKFEVFFDSKDFKAIFSPEGLFPIDPGALRIRSAETPPEDEDFLENDFGIWLDV